MSAVNTATLNEAQHRAAEWERHHAPTIPPPILDASQRRELARGRTPAHQVTKTPLSLEVEPRTRGSDPKESAECPVSFALGVMTQTAARMNDNVVSMSKLPT